MKRRHHEYSSESSLHRRKWKCSEVCAGDGAQWNSGSDPRRGWNLRYEYYIPMNDPETVLLIDAWKDQEAIDKHHASPMMQTIASLREKYDLHMTAERYISDDAGFSAHDSSFIRK